MMSHLNQQHHRMQISSKMYVKHKTYNVLESTKEGHAQTGIATYQM